MVSVRVLGDDEVLEMAEEELKKAVAALSEAQAHLTKGYLQLADFRRMKARQAKFEEVNKQIKTTAR